ncbi:hypothetical protein KM043_003777 [Ampulex compressa]|nr:hypothetical protein KM043_003777 [Ampulex compressa]
MMFSDLIWQSQMSDDFLSASWMRSYVTTLLATFLACLLAFCSWTPLRTWRLERAKRIKCGETLPGPPTLPLIGNAKLFAVSINDFLPALCKLIDRYSSPLRLWIGPKLIVIVSRAEDCEVILKSPHANAKDEILEMWKTFLGDGLITSSGKAASSVGEVHRYWRKTILPMLSKKVLDSFVEYFNKHAKVCVDRLEKKVGAGEFDVTPYVVECSTNVMLETIMGTSVDLKRDDMQDFLFWQEKYGSYFSAKDVRSGPTTIDDLLYYRMYDFVYERMIHFWLQVKWLYSLIGKSRQQNRGIKAIHNFTEKMMDKKAREYDEIQKGTIVQERPRYMLIEQIQDHARKERITNKEILRDNIFTLYTAAEDTVKELTSLTLMTMGAHQEIQEKVRAEVLSVVGEGDVEIGHLQDLKYLEMVIKETLRLFPAGPLLARVLTEDVELQSCTLPKGVTVSICLFHVHRNPEYWPNPLQFDPERFTPENIQKRHPYAFLPFSGGVRACAGQRYALMCLKTILANLIRKYRFFNAHRHEDMKLKTDIATRWVDGYNVSIERV